MTVEELLKPRYKVIEGYPDSEYKVGQILSFDKFSYSQGEKNFYAYGAKRLYENYFIPYPHLFKKLEWWEDRKIEDMPEYIKCVIDCRIPEGKILKANWEEYTTVKEIAHRGKNPDFWMVPQYFLPSTEQEYNEQKGR